MKDRNNGTCCRSKASQGNGPMHRKTRGGEGRGKGGRMQRVGMDDRAGGGGKIMTSFRPGVGLCCVALHCIALHWNSCVFVSARGRVVRPFSPPLAASHGCFYVHDRIIRRVVTIHLSVQSLRGLVSQTSPSQAFVRSVHISFVDEAGPLHTVSTSVHFSRKMPLPITFGPR